MEDLKKLHLNLRFTFEKSRQKINFLDVVIKIYKGKSTDGHQYLHYDFCHVEHVKISVVFSQTLQLRRILSEKNDLDSNVENHKEWFRKKGYPEQLIKDQVAGAFQSASNNSANNNKQEKETDVPLVTTYHPRLKDLNSLIKGTYNTFVQTKKLRKFLHLYHMFLSGVPEMY